MPVGCSVPVGRSSYGKKPCCLSLSPMPVGCSVPVGPMIYKSIFALVLACHQCLSAVRSLLGNNSQGIVYTMYPESPMPVGCSVPVGSVPVGRSPLEMAVTNACRLFGPCWAGIQAVRIRIIGGRHQCLSAVRSLLGGYESNAPPP